MNPKRWQQIDELLQSALAQTPLERGGFVAQACAGDEPLRLELESLVAAHEQSENFLEQPWSQVAAGLLSRGPGRSVVGQNVGPYAILSSLGAGGMAEGYLADDQRLGRKIALKLLPDYFIRDPTHLHRFEQEARSASSLNHPNIVTIYEIGEADGHHFIATEFIEGETLRQHIAGAPFALAEVIEIGIQLASALSAAHRSGIVHRDIKPENIMIRPDGFIKVLDFGLAKLTENSLKQRVVGITATTATPINTI